MEIGKYMRLLLTQHNLGIWAAQYIRQQIKNYKPSASKPFVLGLPTGSTPLIMYKELINLCHSGDLSFKDVVTFNMDEYVGLEKNHAQSYNFYMWNNFFKHIDIKPHSVNILNGLADDLDEECQKFEDKISAYGGINLLIGGVGEDGHIAFNEPGSSLNSITRIKTLNYSTILANSRFFDNNVANTPKLALTMGIKTILSANEVVILASGLSKSQAVCQAIEGSISSMCPITALQMHANALLLCDEYAAYELKLKTIKYFAGLDDQYTKLDQLILK